MNRLFQLSFVVNYFKFVDDLPRFWVTLLSLCKSSRATVMDFELGLTKEVVMLLLGADNIKKLEIEVELVKDVKLKKK